MSLELRQLRHVLALAELGNFARAAAALRLSQPALSRSIQSIEKAVGNQLFLRSPSGVIPTDIGRLLIQRARQVVQMAEVLDREVSSNRTPQAGHVAVGGGPYPVESVLSRAVAHFIGEYPLVSFRLLTENWDELLRQLRGREVDFFVAEISTLQQEHDLAIEPMAEHPFFFAARSGHPLAGRVGVTAVDAFSFPLVVMSRIPPRILEPMLAAQRKARDPAASMRSFPSVECNGLAAAKHIVRCSDAILPATLSCLRTELEAGEFTLLGSEPWMSVRYGLVSLKGQAMTEAAGRFRAFVIDAEHEVSLEEQRLAARWKPGVAHRAPGRALQRKSSTAAGRRRDTRELLIDPSTGARPTRSNGSSSPPR